MIYHLKGEQRVLRVSLYPYKAVDMKQLSEA